MDMPLQKVNLWTILKIKHKLKTNMDISNYTVISQDSITDFRNT